MDDPALSFDLLAAALRSDARDLEVFLEVLAGKLSAALPGVTSIEHEGGLFSRKRVRRLQVQLGEHRYELARAGRGLEARHSHSVRGITLKTEAMAVERWIEELSRHLADHARGSDQARQALDRLLQG